MKLMLATSLWTRLLGLLKKDICPDGEVLLLAPCRGIHSFGMRCLIDIAFLDAKGQILLSEREIPPSQSRSCAKAVAVLERRSDPQSYWPVLGERLQVATDRALRMKSQQQ